LLIALLIFNVKADDARTDLKKYYKCHSQLLSVKPRFNDPRVKKIKENKLSGTSACMELISMGKLGSDYKLVNESNETSRKVLKSFQKLHSSWFKLYEFNSDTQDHPVTNVNDSNEMGYFLTVAALGSNIPYKSLLVSPYSYRSIRDGNDENKFTNDLDISGNRHNLESKGPKKWRVGGLRDDPEEFQAQYLFTPRLVEFGSLIGFEKVTKANNSFGRIVKGKIDKRKTDLSLPLFNGAFGTVPYLLLNLGHNDKRADNERIIHRRWSTNLFSDFLCRSLPVIRDEDVFPIVKSKISFRNKKSCMQCHDSIDRLAGITSNLEQFSAGEAGGVSLAFRGVYKHNEKISSDSLLYFRSVNGDLINKKLKNPNELGEELAKLVDPYLCTVKRYFKFFTGIDYQIDDHYNFQLSKEDMEYRNFLIELSIKLKDHQDIKKVITKIFDSKYYVEKQF
jgi:hypothetical protein